MDVKLDWKLTGPQMLNGSTVTRSSGVAAVQKVGRRPFKLCQINTEHFHSPIKPPNAPARLAHAKNLCVFGRPKPYRADLESAKHVTIAVNKHLRAVTSRNLLPRIE